MTTQNPAPQAATSPSPEVRSPAFPTPRAKYNKPPEFDGRDKAAASTFITHLHLHFLAACNGTDRYKSGFRTFCGIPWTQSHPSHIPVTFQVKHAW
jgi:hypothetical protein